MLVTELLARCVKDIGSKRADRETIRHLLVADREFLLLKLHALSFGARVELVRHCSQASCGAKMDLDFDLTAVPIEEQPVKSEYEFVSGDGPPHRFRFRLPDGADQEAACAWADMPAEDMAARLLARCLMDIDGKSPVEPADVLALPGPDRTALESKMERCSPRVHFEMEATCPHCGRSFDARIDPASFALTELLNARSDFEREVHLLAFHYHWSLQEILGLPRLRRRRYVWLLARQLDQSTNYAYAAA